MLKKYYFFCVCQKKAVILPPELKKTKKLTNTTKQFKMKKIYSLLLLAGLFLFGVQSVKAVTFPAGTVITFDATAYGDGMNIYLPGTPSVTPSGNWFSSTSSIITFTLTSAWDESMHVNMFKSNGSNWNDVPNTVHPTNASYTKLVVESDGKTYHWEQPELPANTYNIISNVSAGIKTISADPVVAEAGEEVTITIVPKDGFTVASVVAVDEASEYVDLANAGSNTYSFIMPASDVTVAATASLSNAYIIGNSAKLSDDGETTWTTSAAGGLMSKNGNVFTKTYTNLDAGTYLFKITSGAWNPAGADWGSDLDLSAEGTYVTMNTSGSNLRLVLSKASDVTFTFTYSATGTSSLNVAGTIVKYHVTYDGKGNTSGSVPEDATAYDVNGEVTVLGAGSLVKDGYVFKGWDTDESADEVVYVENNTFNINAETTLYAVWAPVYTVTYNANGAEGDVPADANEYENGAEVTVLGQGALVKEGYAFTGWNTDANGEGTGYAAAATFAMGSANVVLYAQWTKVYTVYFYNNMGWTDVHVNLYTGPYWNETLGSGNNNAAVCNQPMTKIGDSDYYKYEFTGGPYSVVTFTSISQYDGTNNRGYENFYNCAAVYRVDFDATSDNLMFVSTAEWKETYNETGYYSDGIWMKYGDSYSIEVGNTNYRTICLPYAATLDNATAYEVTEVGQGFVKIESVDALAAATPYIYKPTDAGTVTATFSGAPVAKVVDHAFMVGNLNATPIYVETNDHNYVLSNNEFHKVVAGGDGVTIAQYKAFLYSNTDLTPAQGAPARIVVEENNTTGVENIEANGEVKKFFQNGQLFILRDGVVYDATGKMVK